MGRKAMWAILATSLSVVGCSSGPASEDNSLSVFAQRVQRQLDVATDPTAVQRNELRTEQLVSMVDDLRQRRSDLSAKLRSGTDVDQTRARIEIVRIDRHLELVDRLLMRYEQNASIVAAGD